MFTGVYAIKCNFIYFYTAVNDSVTKYRKTNTEAIFFCKELDFCQMVKMPNRKIATEYKYKIVKFPHCNIAHF